MSDRAPPNNPSKSGSERRQRQIGLRLRVTDAERAEIDARAERAGLTVSGYLRALVFGRDTPQPRAARRPPAAAAELIALRYELRKIGGNLNQLAHAKNAGQDIDPSHLAALCAAHGDVLKAVLAALGREPEP